MKNLEALPGMPEQAWQRLVEQLAGITGWRYYHTRFSFRSVAGFPDLVLVRRGRIIFAELKRDGANPSPSQQAWIEELERCHGCEVYVWRPNDWDDVKKILS